MRKKKYDDDNAHKRKTMRPWSNLTDDVLSLVMMKLEVVDFLAFSRVCKSWRSLALSNKNKIIVSKPPMAICSSKNDANERKCYLEDFEGRKLKLMEITGRKCVGVTCGYLILYGKRTSDFLLVNPITRHELHFPDIPDTLDYCYTNDRGILVFSPTISACVFVVINRCYNQTIWFCIAGKQEWDGLNTTYRIFDLIAFKGKIYTTHSEHESEEVRVCEFKLFPKPELVLLETEGFLKLNFRRPGFVTSGENLYLIDLTDSGSDMSDSEIDDKKGEHPYRVHAIDHEKMKCVSREEQGKEYSFFLYNFAMCDSDLQYGRYVVTGENGKGRSREAKMWYFFFDCLNVDVIHE